MVRLVSKCGMDCFACPWGPYPRKGMNVQQFEQYKNCAKEILGYMPIRTPCVTCQTPDNKIPKGTMLPNRRCLIRQCVDKTGIENCAYCARFSCDTLKATAGVWNRKTIEQKRGSPISEKDYHAFVEPFEGIDRLKAIRASLREEEIVEPAKALRFETKVVNFPENLPFSEEENAALEAVHSLLTSLRHSSLGMRDVDTFSQHYTLENRKAHVFRLLWMLGRYGKFQNNKKPSLEIDARTFLASRGSEKKLGIWAFLRDTVFETLSEFGITFDRSALEGVEEKDLTTGTDYLRSAGWILKMSFDQKIGGSAALKALQTFAKKTAFEHFKDADMRVLAEI